MKRILIHDYAGFAHEFELAEELSRRGFEIIYVLSKAAKKNDITNKNKTNNLTILEVGGVSIDRNNFFQRWRGERKYGYLVAKVVEKYKPDIVFSANCPLDAQKSILKASKKINAKFVFLLNDINSIAATLILEQKIPLVGRFIGKYYQSIERKLLRKSHFVIPINPDFMFFLQKWGIQKNKVEVIRDWATLKDLPVEPKRNYWGKEHDLNNNFVFLLTGSMGFKHNPELILKLAKNLSNNSEARVVVVSKGFVVDWLLQQKEKRGLSNLIILPYQRKKDFPFMLASADVLFATLSNEAGIYSAPSRILTYMCAKRPIIFAGPKNNLMSRILVDNEAGIVVSSDNAQELINAAEKLIKNKAIRDKLASNARKYAEKNFDIKLICDKFQKIINHL